MSALLHIDTKVTHPVPRLGSLLHLSMVVHPFDEQSLACYSPVSAHTAIFKLPESAVVTEWVSDNFKPLLEKCLDLSYEEDTKNKASVFEFLKQMKLRYGKLIPTGYSFGQDIAYLYDFLGKDHDLIHHQFLDVHSLGTAFFRNFLVTRKDLESYLNVVPSINKQKPIDDVLHNTKILNKFLNYIQGR